MEDGRKGQRHGQAIGMSELASQPERLVTSLQRLVRIAEIPQDMSEAGEAKNLEILTPKEATRAVLLGIVDGETLLQLCLGSGQFAKEE